jgi:hypothetical protein
MTQYLYSFRCEAIRGETFFRFAKFPEIISSLPTAEFKVLGQEEQLAYASDAVITALQTRIAGRKEIPSGDRGMVIKDKLFVALSVRQAMKIELYRAYLSTDVASISELARKLKKAETLVRRLFDLKHPSSAQEIEDVIGALGKRLLHSWSLEDRSGKVAPRRALRPHPRSHANTRHAAP